MYNQTKFKFSDGWYVFWLIHWVDPTKGATLIRCEEMQSPLIRIKTIQAERAIAYGKGETTDRFLAPWNTLEPCLIANEEHVKRIAGWIAKFGEKNEFSNRIESNAVEKPYPQTIDFKQDKLF